MQLISKLQYHFDDNLIKLDISGCASLLCFKNHLPEYIKLEKIDDNEDSILLGNLKDNIISECQKKSLNHKMTSVSSESPKL